MDKCYKEDSFTIRKNSEHYHRWKTALCQGQSEWLRKKLSIRHRCIQNTFRNAFPNGTPRKLRTNSISDELYDAGGKSLGCIGVFEMDFELFGRKIKHPVRVLQHVTEDIIGIDFINAHHLWYDPVHQEVFFNKTKNTATLSVMSETHLPRIPLSHIQEVTEDMF